MPELDCGCASESCGRPGRRATVRTEPESAGGLPAAAASLTGSARLRRNPFFFSASFSTFSASYMEISARLYQNLR